LSSPPTRNDELKFKRAKLKDALYSAVSPRHGSGSLSVVFCRRCRAANTGRINAIRRRRLSFSSHLHHLFRRVARHFLVMAEILAMHAAPPVSERRVLE